MTDSAVAVTNPAALAEQVVIKGDLSKLSEADRMRYYSATCESLGLNPLTRPFEYINLNGKLTLYATRAAGDQLRKVRGITITGVEPKQVGDLYVVVATGRDKDGREDSSTGAVAISSLRGEALANAMMKAETKAKRRLTLSLAGLGWTDETEIDSIPDAQRVQQPQHMSLAEKVAARREEIESGNGQPETPPADPTTGEVIACAQSPKGEACELDPGHEGDHRRGNKRWPTPHTAPASDGEAPDTAEVEPPSASADPVGAARQVFEGEVVDDDVQAGLELLGDRAKGSQR